MKHKGFRKVSAKAILFAFLTLCLIPLSYSKVSAQTVVLTKNSDMSFGDVDYGATYSGTVQLGTNGSLTLTGATGLSTNGAGQAGSVTITSTGTGIVEIKCDPDGKMKNGNSSLDIANTEITVDAGVSFGSGMPCQGIKNPNPVVTTVDLAANPSPDIFLGGSVVIANGSLNSGTYVTAVGGGKPITIRVVFQ